MQILQYLLVGVHIFVCVFMVIVVLLQGGNSGGVGAAFGGGNSSGFFGATGATSFLGKMTYAMALIFMVTSISLARLQGGGSGKTGLTEKAAERAKTEATDGAAPKPAEEKK